ncbi:MAG: HYR domain-containing protein [Saprospiraceae bacterium]|nr:HYR domain-containing protein [Saprospiraceae bacterium]
MHYTNNLKHMCFVLAIILYFFNTNNLLNAQTFTTISDGNWSNGSIWAGGISPGSTIDNSEIVNVLHEVIYELPSDLIIDGVLNVTGDTLLTDPCQGQSVIINSTGHFNVINGAFIIPLKCGNISANGNLLNHGVFRSTNSYLEIAQNFQSDGGSRQLFLGCLVLGESYTNLRSTDSLILTCVKVGLHGTGNFENLDPALSSIFFVGHSKILLRGATGHFNNAGTLFGDPGAEITHLDAENGDIINTGTWLTPPVLSWCCGGSTCQGPLMNPENCDMDNEQCGCESDYCRLFISCPSFDGGTYACIDDVPIPDTSLVIVNDTCFNVRFEVQADTIGEGCIGDTLIITRLYIAIDDDGDANTLDERDTCIQVFKVVDNIKPIVICPANSTINCNSDSSPATTGTASATDNCTNVVTNISFNDVQSAGSCNDNYTISRTWSATDSCGNSSNPCVQTITVQDTTRPVIVCPLNVIVNCESDKSPTTTGTASATDNCTNVVTNISFNDVQSAGSCNDNYTISRTWSATDSCGNSSNPCVQTITVQDTTRPVIVCPLNVIVNCESDKSPATTGTASATDNCTNVVTNISFNDVQSAGSCNDNYTISRTWSATDSCGNSSNPCVQTITVQDTTRPVIVCPVNRTVNCESDKSPATTGTASATDNCTNVVTNISFNDVQSAGSCNDNYTISRTWSATDSCGNSSNPCVQTITVQDTTRPVIVCPLNVIVNCESDKSPATTGTASATDNCTNVVTNISFNDVQSAGSCNDNYTISRTWSATDSCGNSSNPCVQTITVQDTTRPVIVCPLNVIVNCESDKSPATTGTASATDNCTNVVTNISFNDVQSAGSCNDNYTISRTWSATDSCGNSSNPCVQTITVQDTTRPMIVCPLNVIVNCESDKSPATTGTASATDNCTNVVTNISFNDVQSAGSCNDNYTISRTWSATDSCGNSSNPCVQTITVQDTTRPVIVCPLNVIVNCESDKSPATTGTASATDNCTNVVTNISFNDVQSAGSCNDNYTISRTWSATDSCGNSSNPCVQTITVQDTTRPVIVCPLNVIVNCESDKSPATTGTASATDNCTNVVTNISFNDVQSAGSCNDNYTISRTWSATDSCGNSSNPCVQTITVQDTTRPMIVCPLNVIVNCESDKSPATTGTASATDNCTNVVTFVSSSDIRTDGICSGNYTISRDWIAMDSCGNSNNCRQIISVQDTTRPIIICRSSIIYLDISGEAILNADSILASVNDNCGVLSYNADQLLFNCNDPDTSLVTLLAIDSCGNTASCIAQVFVVDSVSPIIICPSDIVLFASPGNCKVIFNYAITASDNCGDFTITQTDLTGFESGSYFPEGPTQLSYLATDSTGNTSACSFNISVIPDLSSNPPIVCKSFINVSVDENCEFEITPSMIYLGGDATCYNFFKIILCDKYTRNPLINIIDKDLIGKSIVAKLVDTITGNSCWSDILIEDKLAPSIICRADTTDCYTFHHDFPLNYEGFDCSHYTVKTINEQVEHFECNDEYLKAVYREILINDYNGNTDQCTDTILVERIKAEDVYLPDTEVTLYCEFQYSTDEHGHPSPYITGLPYTYTHDGSLIYIWPLNLLLDCNILVSYEDLDLGEINCVRKIMRSWTVREWWCNTEITRTQLQIIIIKDTTAPVITHAPYGFEATTGRRDCEARVLLPSIEAEDACHNKLRIDVAYPGGILLARMAVM